MKIFRKILLMTLPILVAELFTACENQEPKEFARTQDGLKVYLTFADGHEVSASRATTNPQDQWGVLDFSVGDELGFYSIRGNADAPGGNGPFYNVSMSYQGKSGNSYVFNTDNLNLTMTNLTASGMYMYYPYYGGMGVELPSGDMDPEDATGLLLRKEVEVETSTGETVTQKRCIDFMGVAVSATDLTNGYITGSISHEFFQIVILRGQGFENPTAPVGEDPDEIIVVLDQPYSHIKVQQKSNNTFVPELVYSGGEFPQEIMAYREWNAWRGADYPNAETGEPASYVFLPVTANQVPSISYIKIRDNNGIMQTVSSFNVSNGNKNLVRGSILPLTVKMDGLVPTVYPATITSWNGDVNLTNEREKGIRNYTDLEQWLKTYNLYKSDPSDSHREDLYNYGDYTEGTGGENGIWHFYLMGDFDLSQLPEAFYIPEFSDILDGQSTELEASHFQNHTLSNFRSAQAMFGTLSGTLMNIDFNDLEVTSDIGSDGPVGIIANNFTNGLITNCNLTDGYIMHSATVGVIAGKCDGGSVSDSSFSAFLIGGNTGTPFLNYLFGEVENEPQISETDYYDIIFTPYSLP
ncbi:MAG: hypothetical protein J1F16_00260 [Muribaculaceae bacterium]|nr:hypothetical protein [Muribaculaceae bacterium]